MAEKAPDFVHLHVHTQYSLLDGAIRLGPLFKRAGDYDMEYVAITDHGTMFGALDFYQGALKAGLKPVIGCECYVAPGSMEEKTAISAKGVTHLVLLAENQEGYRNLCRLVSEAQLRGFYYRPRIDKEMLEAHTKGLIALSACLHGEVSQHILHGDMAAADASARYYEKLFGEGNYYLEVQNNGLVEQEKVNEALFDMSSRLSIPLVATNDCHYLDKGDVKAHDVLLCIQTGKVVTDTERFKFGTDQLYFKPPQEMADYFSDHPESLRNTVDIAKRCAYEFDFSYHFPCFDTPPGQDVDALFESEVRKGYAAIMDRLKASGEPFDEELYKNRLEHEIRIIREMEFPGYFLIVADFIRHAKQNGVPVGPGRGSAAGSLVAYSLGITGLDPLKYGLIFERFLNPARKSMPDIDVDFCIVGREDVFKYVVEKYGGGQYVAQIITFGKLKPRAVIRDVGRALDIPLREVDQIAKMVPEGPKVTLEKALELEPRLNELARQNPRIEELLEICKLLEGLPRHASTHAAGVVISDRPLTDYLPVYKGKKEEVVTQFDMKCVEKIGLVKFDFLGLRNLTVIANTLDLIKTGGKPVPDLENLDFTDAATYDVLDRGDTTGVFQLESSGMKDLLVRLRPECFDDIIALVALYRPGPLDSGMVDEFVERKHGRKAVEYLVPELEPILKETYGVIVYQEQVMKIAGVLARYSMAEADDLRKAMGKKIAELMAKHRERFISGSKENEVDPDKAVQIFDLMEKFGGYGFNKSHSAAYALIAFQTAWLKAHYPVEFMASLLTSEMHSTDAVVKFISECKSHGIQVLPPAINESRTMFTVSDGKIRFGLVAVKNVGEGAIEAILEAREEKPFNSLFDFCERVDLRRVNKRVVEALIKCGAMDGFGAPRARLMEGLDDAFDHGQRVRKEEADPQMGLFGSGAKAAKISAPELPRVPEWPESDKLAMEKEALGFYITGHPLDQYEDILSCFTTADSLSIHERENGSAVRIGGIIRNVKTITTKRGDLMAFVELEDMHRSVEVTVFSSVYALTSELLQGDGPILVQGKLERDENQAKVLAEAIIPMERARAEWTAGVHLTVRMDRADKKILTGLKEILLRHAGDVPAVLHLRDPGKADVLLRLPETFRLKPTDALNREVRAFLGPNTLSMSVKEATLAARRENGGRNGYRRRKA